MGQHAGDTQAMPSSRLKPEPISFSAPVTVFTQQPIRKQSLKGPIAFAAQLPLLSCPVGGWQRRNHQGTFRRSWLQVPPIALNRPSAPRGPPWHAVTQTMHCIDRRAVRYLWPHRKKGSSSTKSITLALQTFTVHFTISASCSGHAGRSFSYFCGHSGGPRGKALCTSDRSLSTSADILGCIPSRCTLHHPGIMRARTRKRLCSAFQLPSAVAAPAAVPSP